MIENEITNKQLTPALGYVLTNKSETEFLKTIFLADGDSADNYHEVTIEYANTRIKEGGEKYVPNTLEEAKAQKIAEINDYSESDNVNSLTYNGVETWLTPAIRSNYLTSISSAELLGETSITFAIAGQAVTVPLQNAKIMLAKLQRYADACYLVTSTHKADVGALTTIAEVADYNYKAGYPDKLKF